MEDLILKVLVLEGKIRSGVYMLLEVQIEECNVRKILQLMRATLK